MIALFRRLALEARLGRGSYALAIAGYAAWWTLLWVFALDRLMSAGTPPVAYVPVFTVELALLLAVCARLRDARVPVVLAPVAFVLNTPVVALTWLTLGVLVPLWHAAILAAVLPPSRAARPRLRTGTPSEGPPSGAEPQ